MKNPPYQGGWRTAPGGYSPEQPPQPPLLKGGENNVFLYDNIIRIKVKKTKSLAWMINVPRIIKRNCISKGYYLPYNPKLKDRARELRATMTEAEKMIWHNFLKKFRFRVTRQKPIDNYIVDFYCSKLRLVIEIDGEIHHTVEGSEYDLERDATLCGYGLTVMRFTNHDVMNNLDAVITSIETFASKTPLAKGVARSAGGIFPEENPPYQGGWRVLP